MSGIQLKPFLRWSAIACFIAICLIVLPYATHNPGLSLVSFIKAKTAKRSLPYYVVNEFDTAAEAINVMARGDYDTIINRIVNKKNQLGEQYDSANKAEKSDIIKQANLLFTQSLLNQVIPHWYGTKWDYNGYTDVPRNGQIACGYFVSTPLRHMGFNLNRYKLAQTYSLQAVEVLQGTDVIDLSGQSQDSLVNYLLAGTDGFYVIGLDHHIGFMCKHKDKVYMIHSNNTWPSTVCIERAEKSIQIRFSQALVLAKLSNNEQFLKKWILNEAFVIPES
ncbi:hypothetical protein GC194_13100 [bacterium]|nr:hypothetical protein [bacterium]